MSGLSCRRFAIPAARPWPGPRRFPALPADRPRLSPGPCRSGGRPGRAARRGRGAAGARAPRARPALSGRGVQPHRARGRGPGGRHDDHGRDYRGRRTWAGDPPDAPGRGLVPGVAERGPDLHRRPPRLECHGLHADRPGPAGRPRSGRAADRRHLAGRRRNGAQQPADLHPGAERGALRRRRRRFRERLYRDGHLCGGGHGGQHLGRRGAAEHRVRRRAFRADRRHRPCRHRQRARACALDRVLGHDRHRLRGAARPHRLRHDADRHRHGAQHEPVRR